uniref:Uncharacterized protein n=1 Tax=Solanum tuberosum TaxID=4113 RepID=M1DMB3_SOLTU
MAASHSTSIQLPETLMGHVLSHLYLRQSGGLPRDIMADPDMNTRANPRRMEEEIVNKGVPPQGPQGDQVRLGNQVRWIPRPSPMKKLGPYVVFMLALVGFTPKGEMALDGLSRLRCTLVKRPRAPPLAIVPITTREDGRGP